MSQLSRRLVLTLIGSSALLPLAAEASALAALPVDHAPRDAALVRVRAAVLEAVKARDFQRLRPHVDPKIALDFGGGSGVAELGRRLAGRRWLWEELHWALTHGGRFQKDRSFWAPYTFTAPLGGVDAFEAGIVVDDNVSAHAEARRESRVVATLGREVIRVTDWRFGDAPEQPFYARKGWVKVELPGKRVAWVQARHVRSAVDYRAGFTKTQGVWKMSAFIAGD